MTTALQNSLPLEDEILSYTHSKRKEVVEHITKGGIPNDKADVSVLLKALDGMDHSALSRKRIKVEEAHNKHQEHAAALISKVLAANASNRTLNINDLTERTVPLLGDDIPEPNLVPGETLIAVTNQTYDEFMVSVNK